MNALFSITTWRIIFQKYGKFFAIFMALVLVIGFGFNQFGSAFHQNPQGNSQNKPALRVDGITVSLTSLQSQQSQALQQTGVQSAAATVQANVQGLAASIENALVSKLAQLHHVVISPAAIDSTLDEQKKSLGIKNNSQWQSYLSQMGLSEADLRKQLATNPILLGQTLLTYYRDQVHLTDQDVENQNIQVQLAEIVIPYGANPFAPQLPHSRMLTQKQAQQKANALYQQVQAGKNIQALAKANKYQSGLTAPDGTTQFQPEYAATSSPFGALGYGPAFDTAVQQAATGALTPVVQSSGFQKVYIFAKVLSRKTVTPKGWNLAQAKQQLIQEKASQAYQNDLQKMTQQASIQILDPNVQPYYDIYQASMAQNSMLQAETGQAASPSQPSQAQIKQMQTQAFADFAALLKRKPSDASAAFMVATDITQNKMKAPGITSAQIQAYNQQLIGLYKTVLDSVEDRSVRFQLADLYKQMHNNTEAVKQYETIEKYMAQSPPSTPQDDQQYITEYQRLASDLNSMGQTADVGRINGYIAQIKKQLPLDQAHAAAQGGGSPLGAGGMPASPAPSVPAAP